MKELHMHNVILLFSDGLNDKDSDESFEFF